MARRFFNCGDRHAGRFFGPARRRVFDQRFDLLPSDRVRRDEAFVDQALAADHVHHAERERRVGSGERLQVDVRLLGAGVAYGIDGDHRRRRLS